LVVNVATQVRTRGSLAVRRTLGLGAPGGVPGLGRFVGDQLG